MVRVNVTVWVLVIVKDTVEIRTSVRVRATVGQSCCKYVATCVEAPPSLGFVLALTPTLKRMSRHIFMHAIRLEIGSVAVPCRTRNPNLSPNLSPNPNPDLIANSTRLPHRYPNTNPTATQTLTLTPPKH